LCDTIPANLGSYSIPPEALAYLTQGTGTVSIQAQNVTRFTPPLVGGGRVDFAHLGAVISVVKTVTIQ
jgi:hypothetical protein